MVKLIICAKRKPAMAHEEFDAYRRDQHGPLVRSVSRVHAPRQKVRPMPYSGGFSVPFGAAASTYDGVAELWFDSVEEIAKAFKERRYLEIIRPDELKFVDITNCLSLITGEIPIA